MKFIIQLFFGDCLKPDQDTTENCLGNDLLDDTFKIKKKKDDEFIKNRARTPSDDSVNSVGSVMRNTSIGSYDSVSPSTGLQ